MIVVGLALHAVLDGGALALAVLGADEGHAEAMALAVLFHRLPLGFIIVWIAPRSWSIAGVMALAGLLALATLAGFELGQEILGQFDVFSLAIFEGLVAGVLFHVVLVHPPNEAGMTSRQGRYAASAGVLIGFGLVALMLHGGLGHAEGEGHSHTTNRFSGADGFLETFLALAAESAPALIAAFVGAGLLRVFLNKRVLAWLGRGRSVSQAFRGMAFGLPLPICSCGVVPLYEGLIRAGTPAAAALAFLVATPEIGLGAVLISVPLLGMEMTIMRVLCAIAAAWVIAVVTVRVVPTREADTDDVGLDFQEGEPLATRIGSGLRYGLQDLVEDVMPWVIVGLGIAALLEPLLDASGLRTLSPWIQVPLAGLMGMPVYVCASGSTPIIAVLLFSGLSPGAGIAFLLTGPATNIVTFGLLSSLHSRRTAVVFGVTTAIMACVLGWMTNLWSPTLSGIAGDGMGHEHRTSPVYFVSLLALALITGAAMFRRGPRALIAKVVSSHQHVHVEGEPHTEQNTSSCCPESKPEASACDAPPPSPAASGCCDKPSEPPKATSCCD